MRTNKFKVEAKYELSIKSLTAEYFFTEVGDEAVDLVCNKPTSEFTFSCHFLTTCQKIQIEDEKVICSSARTLAKTFFKTLDKKVVPK